MQEAIELARLDQLAKRLNLSRKRTWNFLHRLVRQGFLRANKRKRPYLYSMAGLHDSVLDRN